MLDLNINDGSTEGRLEFVIKSDDYNIETLHLGRYEVTITMIAGESILILKSATVHFIMTLLDPNDPPVNISKEVLENQVYKITNDCMMRKQSRVGRAAKKCSPTTRTQLHDESEVRLDKRNCINYHPIYCTHLNKNQFKN